MKIVLLGGGGLMARATARDLLERDPRAVLTLADRDGRTAREVATSLTSGTSGGVGANVAVVELDAGDEHAVRDAIRGADVVINAAQYYVNVPVMHAALAERVAYVDLGGLYHVTREQLALDGLFAEAGVTAIVGMGSTPGITNVQARYAVEQLEQVHRIGVYCANTPEADAPERFGYSIDTILDELTTPPIVFRDGKVQELEPLAEPTVWEFLHPIGTTVVHHSLHSELATLPSSFAASGLRECFFKLNRFGYTPRALDELRSLVASMPRDEVIEHLRRRRRVGGEASRDSEPFVLDHEEVAVHVAGQLAGRPAIVRIDTLAAARENVRISGGTLLTAVPPAIVAAWLADGSLRAPGVHPPESVVEPSRLFQALAKRGITTTVAGPDTRVVTWTPR
ncbi:MAG: saccharopine dehydrogenase family protein [Candidatus Limnocylindria bacterium]